MEKRLLPLMIAVLLAAAASGCATSPRLTLADPSSLAELRLADLAKQIANSGQNLHSLIIEYQGKPMVELYRNGWDTSLSGGGGVFSLWTEIGPGTIHDTRSTSKSIVALLAGIVLSRHPAYSVHSKIADFPELSAKAPGWAQEIELGDLLGMTGGLSWKEWGHGFLDSDETALAWKGDPVGYYLDRPLSTKPGEEFNYSGGSSFAASRMIELIDGRNIAEIASAELFQPLGISAWQWGKGLHGYHLPYSGLGLVAGDMLKIGQLMLAQGTWQGRQLIAPEWIQAVTAPRISVNTDFFDLDAQGTRYGYGWWNGTVDWFDGRPTWYSTVGNGGQKIFVVPQLKLIVVMTAGDYGNPQIQIWETGLLRQILEALQPEA